MIWNLEKPGVTSTLDFCIVQVQRTNTLDDLGVAADS